MLTNFSVQIAGIIIKKNSNRLLIYCCKDCSNHFYERSYDFGDELKWGRQHRCVTHLYSKPLVMIFKEAYKV